MPIRVLRQCLRLALYLSPRQTFSLVEMVPCTRRESLKRSERTGSYSPFAIESTEGSDGSVSALSRAFAWCGRIYGTTIESSAFCYSFSLCCEHASPSTHVHIFIESRFKGEGGVPAFWQRPVLCVVVVEVLSWWRLDVAV